MLKVIIFLVCGVPRALAADFIFTFYQSASSCTGTLAASPIAAYGVPNPFQLSEGVCTALGTSGNYIVSGCNDTSAYYKQYTTADCSGSFTVDRAVTDGYCQLGDSSGMSISWTCAAAAIPGDVPCLSSDATGCRVIDATVPPLAAHAACFASASNATGVAERVPLSALTAGDLVLSADNQIDSLAFTRVVVNQHRTGDLTARLLTIHHTKGTLGLTPDHALYFDGTFDAAHRIAPGAVLSSGATVTRATITDAARVVNPITINGKILAAGASGAPIVAATHPEWAAAHFLSSSFPFPYSVVSLLSFLFPAETQEFYDAVLEPSSAALVSASKLAATLPCPLLVLLFPLADIILAGVGVGYTCGVKVLVTSTAVVICAILYAKRAAK